MFMKFLVESKGEKADLGIFSINLDLTINSLAFLEVNLRRSLLSNKCHSYNKLEHALK